MRIQIIPIGWRSIFVLVIVVLLQPSRLISQDKLTYYSVDSSTYSFYMDRDWSSLVYYGDKALENNIDFYYLRLRMGDASIELNEYSNALKHFEKAIEFDVYSHYGIKQQYLTLKLMGKSDRAYQLYARSNVKAKNKLTKPSMVEFVNFDVGYTFSPNLRDKRQLLTMGADSLFGTQYLLGDQRYFQMGLKIHLLKNLSLFASFNNIKIETKKEYQYANYEGVSTINSDWGYARYPDTIPEYGNKSHSGEIIQNELYLKAKLLLDNGFSVSGFSNFLFVKTDLFKYSYQPIQNVDTAYYINETGQYQLFDYTESNYDFYVTDTSFVNFVAGINIEKDIDIAIFDFATSFSNLKGGNQIQMKLSAVYFPLKTYNFYGKTGLTYNSINLERHGGEDQRNNFIFHQSLSIKVFKLMWADIALTYGNLTNSNINNGFVVYNLTDQINYKFKTGIRLFINHHLEFTLYYQMFDKTRYYYSYMLESDAFYASPISYKTHSILGGIKWNF